MNNNKEHSYFVMPARRVSKSSGHRAVLVIDNKEYDSKDIHWEVHRNPRHPIYTVKAEPEKVKTEKTEKVKKKGTMPPYKSTDPHLACVTSGLNVIARNEDDGLYYAGHVLVTLSRKFAVVVFENNEQQETMTKLIIPMGGSVPRPELQIGDYVLVRVLSVDAEKECYVPGRVRHLPQRLGDQMKFYTIIMYNGQECTTMRSHLVKIGQVRFYESVEYIAELQSSLKNQQKAEKEEETQRSRSSITKSKSRSKSRSRSRSRSRSKSRSRSRSESKSRSRSRSESESRSRSSSKSRSRSRSRSRSERKSRSYSRSRSRSRSLSKSRSRSRSRNEDRIQGRSRNDSNDDVTPVSDRKRSIPPSPTPDMDENRIRQIINEEVTRSDIFITKQDIEKQLQAQQMQQEKQKLKLVKHSRKIERIKKKLDRKENENQQVPVIIDETGKKSEPVTRKLKGELEEGEEVLACWPDDGWFYWGTVSEKLENQIYVIRDQIQHQEEIRRDLILTDSENTPVNLQHHDYVIAPHPEYKNSYAPGEVLSVRNREVEIKFYDDEVGKVDLGDVFTISSDQYEPCVRYIRKCEKDLIGRKVLTRNDDNGRYFLGKVLGITGSGLQYKIQCSDGATISQKTVHVFKKDDMKRITHLQDNDYILAKPYGKSYYIPAVIERSTPPNVKFCDGSRNTGSDDCLLLGEDYFNNAKEYYLARAHLNDE
ncbi:hypothetical protein ACJMK2_030935 [Sinanodonta woodiana]|uniref:DUF4537 domain-containing protein n=1 Tax=Sinanodonta woodiana TaxID=1069815 RepID=A0ABD3WX89_SINWO